MRLFLATLGLSKEGTKAELTKRFPGGAVRALLKNSNVRIPSRACKADLIDLLLTDPADTANISVDKLKQNGDESSGGSIIVHSKLGSSPGPETELKLGPLASGIAVASGATEAVIKRPRELSMQKEKNKKRGRKKGKLVSRNFELPEGWTVIRKKNPKTEKEYVANYVSPAPDGKRFRSLVEVMRHLGVLPKEYDDDNGESVVSKKADVFVAMGAEERALAEAEAKVEAKEELLAEAKLARQALKEAKRAAKIAQQKSIEHVQSYMNRGFRIEEVYLDIGPAGEKQVYVCPEKLSKSRKDASLSGL